MKDKTADGGELLLFGRHVNNLDSKGRVFLPSKFRNDLGSSVVVFKGSKPCIMMFTEDEFLRFYEKLIKNGSREVDAQDELRFLTSSAETLEPDSQGRVMLPEELRKYACLEREVAFLGMVKYVEIWDSQKSMEEISGVDPTGIDRRLRENGY